MTDLTLDTAVAARMGHEEAVAATSIDAKGILVEFALLPPEDSNGKPFQREWVVAIHQDCDPDKPEQGTSGMEPCGEDRAEAEAHYLECVSETKHQVYSELIAQSAGF
jgi:hypothetical protein